MNLGDNVLSSKFTNYYIAEVKCKILVTDEDDPINSQIHLESRIKNYFSRVDLEFESMEISSGDVFKRTHYIRKNPNYVDCYFEKVETDSGYYYRTFYNEFKNNEEHLISKADHITIDGIDYIENEFARYKIIEVEKDHFKKLNDSMKSPGIVGNNPSPINQNTGLVSEFYEYKCPKISSENS